MRRQIQTSKGKVTTDSETQPRLVDSARQELGTRSLPAALNPVTGVAIDGRI